MRHSLSVNAFSKFLSLELILVIHGYDQRMSKVDLHLSGLWLQLKRFGTEYAAQKINFFISAVPNGHPLPL